MWTLKKIHAEGLCAFHTLDWELPQGITTLIFGDNLDNDSQRSNGSGKSALIEAIAIGLIGDPLRKATINDIINDGMDKTIVSLEMHNAAENLTMVIDRKFNRKSPQSVEVTVNGEKIAQPSVGDYNKYILDTIGLSREDLVSSFVLSENKYISFLSSRDTAKKELINRFSNGIMVDEAIAAVEEDIAPVKQSLAEAESKVSFLSGQVDALAEQIDSLANEASAAESRKEEQIQTIQQSIANHRASIRLANERIKEIDEDWGKVETLESKFKDIEESNLDFESAYKRIASVWDTALLGELTDSTQHIASIRATINELLNKQAQQSKIIAKHESSVAELKHILNGAISDHKNCKDKNSEEAIAIQKQIDGWKSAIASSLQTVNELLTRKNKATRYISNLQQQLAGSIKCPNCGHKWVVASEQPIDELKSSLEKAQKRMSEIEAEISKATESSDKAKALIQEANSKSVVLDEEVTEKAQAVSKARKNLADIEAALNRAVLEEQDNEMKLKRCQEKLSMARTTMFDTVFDAVDNAINGFDRDTKIQENDIAARKGTIKSLELSLKEIEETSPLDAVAPLKASLEAKSKELAKATAHKDDVEQELQRLTTQETRFNEFKTYLANTKIAALSQITNEFLEQIGSDIRISFSGYTILKSGKIRDKISIALLRDGIDCGAFGKFSKGERTRVELATILALQKLTNMSCPEGKGLDLLVLDEILEAVDEDGLAAIFEALNGLHLTSLVVSHGNIAENYPHKLIIHKKNGVSFINGNQA